MGSLEAASGLGLWRRRRGSSQVALPMAGRLAGDGGCGPQPQARSEAGRARSGRSVVGRPRPSRRAPARRSGQGQGAHRRARAPGRTPTGGPRFFSRSLAVMGRQTPRERRAHLFAVIEKMTREGPQGETDAPAGRVAHLRSIASLSRATCARRRGSARLDPAAGAQGPARRLSAHHAKAQGREASSSTPSACSGSCGRTIC